MKKYCISQNNLKGKDKDKEEFYTWWWHKQAIPPMKIIQQSLHSNF